MRNGLRYGLAIAVLLCAAPMALAAPKPWAETLTRTFPLDMAGAVVVENPNGKITITGKDAAQVVVRREMVIRGVDAAAIKEGRARTQVLFGGDAHTRTLRTIAPYPIAKNRWVPVVNYTIEMPRTAQLTVVSYNGDPVHVNGLTGRVQVKTINGMVRADAVTGPLVIETVNANIFAKYASQPANDIRLSSVNGLVELRVPGDSRFGWVAETLKGQMYVSLPNRGGFVSPVSRQYRSSVNGGSRPIVQTTSITGPLFILRPNDARDRVAAIVAPQAQPVIPVAPRRVPPAATGFDIQRVRRLLIAEPASNTFALKQGRIEGDFGYAVSMGNIALADVRGNTKLSTQGGEIIVGRVGGEADLFSRGGPINVGDVFGPLRARTGAGDVHVRAAHRGGVIATNGGNIELLYAGAPIDVRSGGGDIAIRRVAGDVDAETKSGDIMLFMEHGTSGQAIDAKTGNGSIWLNLEPTHRADVDITVLTTPGMRHTISSEIPGLTITRETVDGRLRLRAVGKINGGGARIELHAENGGVQITSKPTAELLTGRVQ